MWKISKIRKNSKALQVIIHRDHGSKWRTRGDAMAVYRRST